MAEGQQPERSVSAAPVVAERDGVIGRRLGELEDRWISVGGLTMYTRVSTNPVPKDAPPVVLVHGFVISSRYMVPTAVRLAPYFPVYAPDLPGFGRSAKPQHVLTLPELSAALDAWMAAVGLARAAFLGNSFGCQMIVDFATRYPERVDRAVLTGPPVDPEARTTLGQVFRLLLDAPREKLSLWLLHLPDYMAAGFSRAWQTRRYVLRDRIEEKLPHVHVPVLVVRGSRDPIVPQDWAEEVTRLLPQGRLVVIPGAPHALNYSRPADLVRVAYPFLSASGLARVEEGA